MPVAKNLHLDMPRPGDKLLQENPTIFEARLAGALHRRVRFRHFRRFVTEFHADATAARGALQHHRQTDPQSLGRSMFGRVQQRRAGQQRHAVGPGNLARRVFQTKRPHLRRCRSNERQSRVLTSLRKGRIFTQETVTRVNRFGPRFLCRRNYLVNIQVALRCRSRADQYGLTSPRHMQRMSVSIGIYGHRADTHPVQRTNDAAGNRPAVSYQNFAEHLSPPRHPKSGPAPESGYTHCMDYSTAGNY